MTGLQSLSCRHARPSRFPGSGQAAGCVHAGRHVPPSCPCGPAAHPLQSTAQRHHVFMPLPTQATVRARAWQGRTDVETGEHAASGPLQRPSAPLYNSPYATPSPLPEPASDTHAPAYDLHLDSHAAMPGGLDNGALSESLADGPPSLVADSASVTHLEASSSHDGRYTELLPYDESYQPHITAGSSMSPTSEQSSPTHNTPQIDEVSTEAAESGAAPSSLPQPTQPMHEGVTIRVTHPTCINTSRERHWALLQELVPREEWQRTAIVLACLESIYRAEYLASGQAAVAALQAANAACVPADSDDSGQRLRPRRRSPNADNDRSPSPSPSPHPRGSTGARGGSASQNGKPLDAPQSAHTSPTAGTGAEQQTTEPNNTGEPPVAAVAEAVHVVADAAATVLLSAAAGALEAGPQPLLEPEPETLQEAAARLDVEMATLLTLLVRRSHFQPLTQRDVEVAKTLNRDYLSQLFIVGDLRRMDKGLVRAVAGASWPTLPGSMPLSWQPAAARNMQASPGSFEWCDGPLPSATNGAASRHEPSGLRKVPRGPFEGALGLAGGDLLALESESLLLLKRCWGEETATGRLLLQKLDFLQTLAVSDVLDKTRAALVSFNSALRTLLSGIAEEMRTANTGLGTAQGLREEARQAEKDTQQGQQQAQEQEQMQRRTQELHGLGQHQGEQVQDWQDHQQQQQGQRQPSANQRQVEGPLVQCQQGPWEQQGQRNPPESDRQQPHRDLGWHSGTQQAAKSADSWMTSRAEGTGTESERDEPPVGRGWAGFLGSGADWSQRLADAGVGWARWFSERGVGPRLDVLPMEVIDRIMPVRESPRLRPLRLRKVALREIMGSQPMSGGLGSLLRLLLQQVNLQEPSLREFAVVYRRLSDAGRAPPALLRTIIKAGRRLRLLPQPPPQPPRPRPPIQIRIYRDLALPTWQLALPDKLLQFRPLDLLRADLFALTGLVALLAQAKYESLLLDVITVVSAGVFIVRIALGFKRMDDRYRSQVAEVLRDKTVASDGTALEYLAAAAGLQQFKQVSLAYIYALHMRGPKQKAANNGALLSASTTSGTAPTAANSSSSSTGSSTSYPHCDLGDTASGLSSGVSYEEMAAAIEQLLWESCRLQVRFDAEEAVSELVRLGLAEDTDRKEANHASDEGKKPEAAHQGWLEGSHASGLGTGAPEDSAGQEANHAQEASNKPERNQAWSEGAGASGEGDEHVAESSAGRRRYRVVGVGAAMRLVQQHWDGLLWQRVDGILREFE